MRACREECQSSTRDDLKGKTAKARHMAGPPGGLASLAPSRKSELNNSLAWPCGCVPVFPNALGSSGRGPAHHCKRQHADAHNGRERVQDVLTTVRVGNELLPCGFSLRLNAQ
jgi:hypothetical protein